MENSSLWIPTAIHKLPNQVKGMGGGGRGGAGKGDCTHKVDRRPLRYCFSAGARAMYVYFFFFFFTTTCFGLYLKSFICFLFLKKLVDTTISWSNGQVKGSPCIYMLP